MNVLHARINSHVYSQWNGELVFVNKCVYVFLGYRQTKPVKELPLAAIVTTPCM